MAKKQTATKNSLVEQPKLRLEWLDPKSLTENPDNWRTHPPEQMAALAGSIEEVDWAGACLYNETTGRLVDGHARRQYAIEKGLAAIPVLVGKWTEAEERKILATLDPIAAMAGSNAEVLQALIKGIETSSEGLGKLLENMTDRAAEDIIRNLAVPDDEEPAEDPGTPPPAEWKSMPLMLTVSQEAVVRDAVKHARKLYGEELTTPQAIVRIAEEWHDAKRT